MLPSPSSSPLPLLGGLVAFGAALSVALLWFLGVDEASPEPASPPAPMVLAPEPAPQVPALVEVDAGVRKAKRPRARTKAAARKPRAEKPARAPNARLAELRAKRRARSKELEQEPKEEGPELVPFYVQPIFDTSALEDFDSLATCRFHSRLPGEEPTGGARSVFYQFTSFVAGRYADPLTAPEALIVRFDHPGALPAEVKIGRSSWATFGDGYIARPTIRLEPVESTIAIGLERSDAGLRYSGSIHLLQLSELGELTLLDEQPLSGRSRRREKSRLRVPRGVTSLLAVALAKSDSLAPDLLAPLVPLAAGDYDMKNGVRPLPYERKIARVVDPFGEPFEGATLIGVVNDNRVAIRRSATGAPASYRGHVFIQTPPQQSARFDGTITSSTAKGEGLGLMAVKGGVSGQSERDGVIDMTAILDGVYDFVLQVPQSLEPEPVLPFQRSSGLTRYKGRWLPTLTVAAPVGGVEVERPASLGRRSDWKRAKITLTAGDQTIPVVVDKAGRARGYVPPFTAVSVRVESGGDVFLASVASLAPGDRATAIPVKAEGDSDGDD